jgi:hypothetical protein
MSFLWQSVFTEIKRLKRSVAGGRNSLLELLGFRTKTPQENRDASFVSNYLIPSKSYQLVFLALLVDLYVWLGAEDLRDVTETKFSGHTISCTCRMYS